MNLWYYIFTNKFKEAGYIPIKIMLYYIQIFLSVLMTILILCTEGTDAFNNDTVLKNKDKFKTDKQHKLNRAIMILSILFFINSIALLLIK